MQDVGGPKTWQECFRCSYMLFNSTHCRTHLSDEARAALGCGTAPKLMTFVQYSSYAAQLAWWLAFFPPEQFLILTVSELRDPSQRTQVRRAPFAPLHELDPSAVSQRRMPPLPHAPCFQLPHRHALPCDATFEHMECTAASMRSVHEFQRCAA